LVGPLGVNNADLFMSRTSSPSSSSASWKAGLVASMSNPGSLMLILNPILSSLQIVRLDARKKEKIEPRE
jgi:hypothetical protein